MPHAATYPHVADSLQANCTNLLNFVIQNCFPYTADELSDWQESPESFLEDQVCSM